MWYSGTANPLPDVHRVQPAAGSIGEWPNSKTTAAAADEGVAQDITCQSCCNWVNVWDIMLRWVAACVCCTGHHGHHATGFASILISCRLAINSTAAVLDSKGGMSWCPTHQHLAACVVSDTVLLLACLQG
jgi:hypothetical protein